MVRIVIMFLILGISGCSNVGFVDDEVSTDEMDRSKIDPVLDVFDDTNEVVFQAERLTLQDYSVPGVLSIQKPEGWQFSRAGEYNTLGFLTYDENEPLSQVFLFGEIGIFYTSAEQKGIEQNYQANGGYSVPWIDMPVISPFDGQTFFENFQALLTSPIGNQFRAPDNMPVPFGFDSITVISQEQVATPIQGLECYYVQAVLANDGQAAKALMMACPYSDGFGHGSSYFVAGMSAPMKEFNTVMPDLYTVLNSFAMDPSYVQAGVNTIQQNGEVFRQISETLSQTSDIITSGYEARNKTMDIIMEKKSDQILDVERIYDPETGEVYEVKNGFFEYYDIHRQDYPKPNLQQLPADDHKIWTTPQIINHSYVAPN